MPELFIHPGFGKSATTSLQNNLFGRHPEIRVIGRPYTEDSRALCKSLVRNIGFYNKDAVNDALKKLNIAEHAGAVVLSEETLANAVHANQAIVERLKEQFPGAQIFFTLRNQLTAVPSYYAAHGRILKRIPRPYAGRHIRFDDWFEFASSDPEHSFLGILMYKPVIDLFAEVFGRGSIHLFLYEELVSDLPTFSTGLSEYLGIDAPRTEELLRARKKNTRDSGATVGYKVFREKFLPGFHPTRYLPFGSQAGKLLADALNRSGRVKVAMTKAQENHLRRLYAPHNQALSEEYGLELGRWGYPV